MNPLTLGLATLFGVVTGAIFFLLIKSDREYVVPYAITGFAVMTLLLYVLGVGGAESVVTTIGSPPNPVAFIEFILIVLATLAMFNALHGASREGAQSGRRGSGASNQAAGPDFNEGQPHSGGGDSPSPCDYGVFEQNPIDRRVDPDSQDSKERDVEPGR